MTNEITSIAELKKWAEEQLGSRTMPLDGSYYKAMQDVLEKINEFEAGVRERINFLSPPLAKDSLTIKELRRVLEGDKSG